MRYMIIIAGDEKERCDQAAAGGNDPAADMEIVAAYQRYTEELKRAGVLLGGEALEDSVRGARVTVTGGKRNVTDGPFSEAKEVVGGFYLIQVKSKEEAIEWASRCPAAHHGPLSYVEVREVMEFPA